MESTVHGHFDSDHGQLFLDYLVTTEKTDISTRKPLGVMQVGMQRLQDSCLLYEQCPLSLNQGECS